MYFSSLGGWEICFNPQANGNAKKWLTCKSSIAHSPIKIEEIHKFPFTK